MSTATAIKIPNTLLNNAVVAVRNDWCPEFFKGRKKSPDRVFCEYFEQQHEDVLRSYQLIEADKGSMTYRKITGIDLALVRCDESLQAQDRRDLDKQLIRSQTMRSFQKNGDEINSPALILRERNDGTFDEGDGRHRHVWSVALGCTTANAFVVRCPDDIWDTLREDFNDMNGAQRTHEERLYLVYRKWQEGGHGSVRELCRRHGLPEPQFNAFKELQRAKSEAEKKGLAVAAATPAPVLQAAVKVLEKVSKEAAQKLLDAGTPTLTSASSVRPTKKSLEKVLEPLQEGEVTEETFEEVAGKLKEETARTKGHRGPNKSHHTKFCMGIDMAIGATDKGSAEEIGLPLKTIENYRRKVMTLLEYLDASIPAKMAS